MEENGKETNIETPVPFRALPTRFRDSELTTTKNPEVPAAYSRSFTVDDYNMFSGQEAIDIHDAAVRMKRSIDELGEYGIKVSCQPVIGLDKNGEKVVFLINQKINGEFLSGVFDRMQIADIIPSVIDKERLGACLVSLVGGIIKYIKHKKENGEPYFWEIAKARNYVFGKLDPKAEADLYFVDTEPDLNSAENTRYLKFAMDSYLIQDLYGLVKNGEKLLGIDFHDAKNLIMELGKIY